MGEEHLAEVIEKGWSNIQLTPEEGILVHSNKNIFKRWRFKLCIILMVQVIFGFTK
jgi:hypothetical protein